MKVLYATKTSKVLNYDSTITNTISKIALIAKSIPFLISPCPPLHVISNFKINTFISNGLQHKQ